MNNKRGWIRILEATISVLIVASVLMVVYTKQVDRGVEPADYFYSLQRQILSDIAISSDMRINVLNVVDNDESDSNYLVLVTFIEEEVPDFVGFSLSICELGSFEDHCKMRSSDFIKTMEKDVFVEDFLISADLGDGTNHKYDPRKVRLYMWEE